MQSPLKLQRLALIETGPTKAVEIRYAEHAQSTLEEHCILIRVPIELEYPVLPEAAIEALTHVRDLIRDEIQRFEKMRGPAR